jgi:hypothetical protein
LERRTIADAGNQFVLVEGLGHVVVGASAEAMTLSSMPARPEDQMGLDLRHPNCEHVVAGHVGRLRSRRIMS